MLRKQKIIAQYSGQAEPIILKRQWRGEACRSRPLYHSSTRTISSCRLLCPALSDTNKLNININA